MSSIDELRDESNPYDIAFRPTTLEEGRAFDQFLSTELGYRGLEWFGTLGEKRQRLLRAIESESVYSLMTRLVDSTNEFEETYSKKKNLMVFEEEEKKVRETIRELYSKMKKAQNEANSVSNTPFATPMKIIQQNYPVLSPLHAELPLPKKMPPRNCVFDEPPEYREEDFLLQVEEEGESIAS